MTGPMKLGVVGGGQMGQGIAQIAAQAGLDVILVDVTAELYDPVGGRSRAVAIPGLIPRAFHQTVVVSSDATSVRLLVTGGTGVNSDPTHAGNIAKLGGLRPAFAKDGTVTAGNASSLNDGGAALVLMSADAAAKRGLPVLARIVGSGYHAQAPEWFTTAPAPAIEKACAKAGWAPTSVDLWEINEAFSVVSIANNQLLGLDPGRVNVWGGAVALGHPIGASGARIVVTLLHAMAAQGARTGGASLCIGGGEGIAMMVERP